MLGGQDQCCIKGCSEKASFRKITSLAGVLELEIEPDLISQVNELNIRICNYHFILINNVVTNKNNSTTVLFTVQESISKLVTKVTPKTCLLFVV